MRGHAYEFALMEESDDTKVAFRRYVIRWELN